MAILLGLVAMVFVAAALVGLHRLGLYLEERDIIYYWHKRPRGGSAYNPLQEFYQPEARHMTEVQEHRTVANEEGSPPQPPGQAMKQQDATDH